ncbi:unnamed protein product, partial [Linum tenue]
PSLAFPPTKPSDSELPSARVRGSTCSSSIACLFLHACRRSPLETSSTAQSDIGDVPARIALVARRGLAKTGNTDSELYRIWNRDRVRTAAGGRQQHTKSDLEMKREPPREGFARCRISNQEGEEV